jgi:hypothetical protein
MLHEINRQRSKCCVIPLTQRHFQSCSHRSPEQTEAPEAGKRGRMREGVRRRKEGI